MKGESYTNLSSINNRFQMRSEGDMHTSLSTELKKYYEKSDHNMSVNYIKRTKLYPVMP